MILILIYCRLHSQNELVTDEAIYVCMPLINTVRNVYAVLTIAINRFIDCWQLLNQHLVNTILIFLSLLAYYLEDYLLHFSPKENKFYS